MGPDYASMADEFLRERRAQVGSSLWDLLHEYHLRGAWGARFNRFAKTAKLCPAEAWSVFTHAYDQAREALAEMHDGRGGA